jgi:hypothetical protein
MVSRKNDVYTWRNLIIQREKDYHVKIRYYVLGEKSKEPTWTMEQREIILLDNSFRENDLHRLIPRNVKSADSDEEWESKWRRGRRVRVRRWDAIQLDTVCELIQVAVGSAKEMASRAVSSYCLICILDIVYLMNDYRYCIKIHKIHTESKRSLLRVHRW